MARAPGPVIDLRTLNRALLARQHLLARSPLRPEEMVSHLVGLQAQNPWSPYLGLWSRLEGPEHSSFDPHALGALLESREVVRIAVMRGTIHLVTARDALVLPALTEPVFTRTLRSGASWAARLRPWGQLGFGDLADVARALLEDHPMTPGELGAALGERLTVARPDLPASALDAEALAQGARGLLPLVQVPPRAVWGQHGATRWTTTRAWLGTAPAELSSPEDRQAALESMVLRYLAAFGPATVADVQAWCGLTRLDGVVARLRDRLVGWSTAGGREVLDLPGAPRPSGDVPAPVRFLPDYDNVLLAHADRTRVLDAEHRRALQTANGSPPGTVLVDGWVRATWHLDRRPTGEPSGTVRLTVRPLERLRRGDRADVVTEADHVVHLLAGDATHRAVVLEDYP